VICALLPWNFFASSISQSAGSIIEAAPLVKKVYFPREVLPISIVLGNLTNLVIALPVYFLLALIMGNPITLWVVALPLAVLVQVAFTIGVSLILSTLNVFYRDTGHILDVLLMAWFFVTPVLYPITVVPDQYFLLGATLNLQVWLRRLNPMASIIASYRDLLYWGAPTGWDFMLRTALISLMVLVVGYVVFVRYSPRFGEEL
jgi:ABC-type polysaccharide/polyol phosphate export permease